MECTLSEAKAPQYEARCDAGKGGRKLSASSDCGQEGTTPGYKRKERLFQRHFPENMVSVGCARCHLHLSQKLTCTQTAGLQKARRKRGLQGLPETEPSRGAILMGKR